MCIPKKTDLLEDIIYGNDQESGSQYYSVVCIPATVEEKRLLKSFYVKSIRRGDAIHLDEQ